jgi:ankyrin repeat protein
MGSTEELFEAIEAGDVDAIRSLVAADPRVAAARDAEGVSALMRARYRSDRACTQAILSALPQLDVFEAATFGDLDRLTSLLDADPGGATSRSGDGFTPLHLAAFFGKPEAIAVLLARGAEVDARGRGWMTGTPLHSAASAGHADVAAILLDAGADPDARQTHGWTPLHAAARNGDLALVELLLAHGADAGATNDDGASVRSLAEEGGDERVAQRIRAAIDA